MSHILEAELGGGSLEQMKNSICVILFSQEERKEVGRDPPPQVKISWFCSQKLVRLSNVSLRGLSRVCDL